MLVIDPTMNCCEAPRHSNIPTSARSAARTDVADVTKATAMAALNE
jgi:hypothetical protein